MLIWCCTFFIRSFIGLFRRSGVALGDGLGEEGEVQGRETGGMGRVGDGAGWDRGMIGRGALAGGALL